MRNGKATKKGKPISTSTQGVLKWVSGAWQFVSGDLIRTSFRKCRMFKRILFFLSQTSISAKVTVKGFAI